MEMEIKMFIDFDCSEKKWAWKFVGIWKLVFGKKFGIWKFGFRFGFWEFEDCECWILEFWGKLEFCK